MIVLMLIAVAAVVWRLATKRFTAAEWILLVIGALTYLVLAGQMLGCWGLKYYEPPEMRYWIQAGVLWLGWTAWGLLEVSRLVAERWWKPARFLLPLVVAVFAAIDFAMLVKPHVPGSRRWAAVVACDWAAKVIRADYKGPARDAESVYSDVEYHEAKRPVVRAHTGRLAYLLNGREGSPSKFGAIDLPDYVFDECHKVKLPEGAKYEFMQRFVAPGRKPFELYRRVKEETK